jgi:hypothetical protein
MVDNLFLLAVASLGWGLSLATYRLFARSNGWPMGALHADLPVVPVLIDRGVGRGPALRARAPMMAAG